MQRTPFLVASLLLAACTSGSGERPAPEPSRPVAIDAPSSPPAASPPAAPAPAGGGASCRSDADCVPSQCCHPSSCVGVAEKPDCRALLCSMECRPGTFDCGGGGCFCRGGRCEAEFTPPQ